MDKAAPLTGPARQSARLGAGAGLVKANRPVLRRGDTSRQKAHSPPRAGWIWSGMRKSIPILILALAISAPAGAQSLFGPGLFVSPAGEPFRPASGPAPLEAWFLGADANRDGLLTSAELRADFARFFALLDRDRDGELTPAEVTRYEVEVLPEMRARAAPRPRNSTLSQLRRERLVRGGAGGRPVGSTVMAAGAARFGLLPIPHPVMAADADFNGGVTRAEFDSAATGRFAQLDTAGDGQLTLAELNDRRRHRGRQPD